MGLGNSETDVSVDDGDGDICAGGGGGGICGKSFGSVSCSICLEAVMDNGDRSWAKLQCGHEFHLDCIGSAFNIKGAMQCPNCRKIEKGQWRYANGCRSLPEFGIDDWTHDEDLYDLSYSEMSLGVHWCPFGSLARLPSLFDEGESSSSTYDLIRQQTIFAEQAATVSPATHPCPYIAYFGPIPPSSSNSRGSVSNGSNFNNHWSGISIPSEMPSSYGFPALNLQYHSWDHHSPPLSTTGGLLGSAEQLMIQPSVSQRLPRTSPDAPRSGSFMPPFVPGHSSSARAGSSVRSSMVPHYQGSNARNRDRVQALQAYYQQPTNVPGIRTALPTGTRRPNSHRGPSHVGTTSSTSDQNGLYIPPSSVLNFLDVENPPPGRFRSWERDPLPSFFSNQMERESGWGSFHQATNRQRHGSERMSSQNRS